MHAYGLGGMLPKEEGERGEGAGGSGRRREQRMGGWGGRRRTLMDSIESLVRNNIQQVKQDMADEVINAGRFDQKTTQVCVTPPPPVIKQGPPESTPRAPESTPRAP
eukprot:5851157-Pyramimonas_sp.AAC.2